MKLIYEMLILTSMLNILGSYHGPEVGIDPSNGGASNHNEVSADDVTDNGSSYFNSK